MRPSPIILALAGVPLAPGCNCGGTPVATDDGGDDASMNNGDGGGTVDMARSNFDGPLINPPDGYVDGGIPVHDGGALCFQALCQGKLYECGDCLDNDNDGLIDSEDPQCLGACQNNEKGFYGNIPGQNNAPCKMDCYFDQDTGSGNDDCFWDHSCDPHEMNMTHDPENGCNYDPNAKFPGGDHCADKYMTQSAACHKICGPLTPNGCDCFGCCAIPPNNSMTDGVFLGSVDANGVPTCDLMHAADPTKCRPCQIVQGCFNGCGHCELCVGKLTLPDDCFPKNDMGMTIIPDGGVMGQCPGGEQPCGLQGQAPCPQGFFCVTGCCQAIIG